MVSQVILLCTYYRRTLCQTSLTMNVYGIILQRFSIFYGRLNLNVYYMFELFIVFLIIGFMKNWKNGATKQYRR